METQLKATNVAIRNIGHEFAKYRKRADNGGLVSCERGTKGVVMESILRKFTRPGVLIVFIFAGVFIW